MRRVLIVEHEPQSACALSTNLAACQYEATTAQDGTTALEMAARVPPDAVLLGMDLPDLPGIEVIRGLRGWTSLPIIALSRRAEFGEKVAALDAGADDYVIKPFSMEELLARLRAVLRRPPLIGDAETVDVAGYRIDLVACTAVPASGTGEPLHFTPTEWQLLTTLLRERLGFDGVVVADYFAVAFLEAMHAVAADRGEAAQQALIAGIDVELPSGDAYLAPLVERVRTGLLEESYVDRAVIRVLMQKEQLGLLEPDVFEGEPPAEIDLDAFHKLVAAMDKAGSMTVTVGKAGPVTVSLNGSTVVVRAFETCAGIPANTSAPKGANPFN